MASWNVSLAGELGAGGQPTEEPPLGDHVTVIVSLYAVIMLIGIVGNASLVLALVSAGAARFRSPLLLGLCAADLLVCAVSAPLTVTAITDKRLHCGLYAYAKAFPVSSSTMSLMMLSVERYATVQRPVFLQVLAARPILGAVLAWLGGAISAAAAPLQCSPMSQLAEEALSTGHAVLAYAVPVVVTFACHLSVRARLCALSLTARAAHGELPLPVPLMRRPTHVIIVAGLGDARRQHTSGPRRSPRGQQPSAPSLLGPQPQTSTLRARRTLGNVLVGVSALFACCWLPHAGLVAANAASNVLRYSLLLGHAHSALNPALYWALNHQALAAACAPCARTALRHLGPNRQMERPSSTNEAALGAFHPRYVRAAPAPMPAPSSHYLY